MDSIKIILGTVHREMSNLDGGFALENCGFAGDVHNVHKKKIHFY